MIGKLPWMANIFLTVTANAAHFKELIASGKVKQIGVAKIGFLYRR